MGSENVEIVFTDVELECLSKFLGTLSAHQLVKRGTDSPYLIRAIEKVFRAYEEIS